MSVGGDQWVARTSPGEVPPEDIPPAIWNVLRARGLTEPDEIEKILHPRLRDLAHPFSLDQMDRAVQLLIEAHKKQEPILIYGDYDLDGTPGVALLREGLEKLGFTHLFTVQPSRMNDGYGLHAHLVKKFKDSGVRIVITVDVGITDVEAVDELKKDGINVIVTDHHLPKSVLPDAYAVVNPNKGDCGSRLQHLCGTGVAFYLVLALRMELERQGLLSKPFDPKDLLDLFALATVTDMVPLVKENRILVKHGLQRLAHTVRPGLRLLLGELGLYGRDLTAQDIGFRLAPKLNALTRLEGNLTAYEILTANETNARDRVNQALHVNEKRRALQAHAKQVAQQWTQAHFQPGDPCLFVYSNEFHPGVISLVANDLASEFDLPTFVGAVCEDGRIVGSARAPSTFDNSEFSLPEILQRASSFLTRFGGHRHAAGFELDLKVAEDFRQALKAGFKPAEMSNPVTSDVPSTSPELERESKTLFYDSELALHDFSHRFMSWHEAIGPFGPGFEAPSFLMRGLRIRAVRKLKNKFLRYTLTDGLRELEAPWFENPVEFEKGTKIDFIFEPQWNDYNGRRTLQARILAARIHSSSRPFETD